MGEGFCGAPVFSGDGGAGCCPEENRLTNVKLTVNATARLDSIVCKNINISISSGSYG
jgi:hypothetical protein